MFHPRKGVLQSDAQAVRKYLKEAIEQSDDSELLFAIKAVYDAMRSVGDTAQGWWTTRPPKNAMYVLHKEDVVINIGFYRDHVNQRLRFLAPGFKIDVLNFNNNSLRESPSDEKGNSDLQPHANGGGD